MYFLIFLLMRLIEGVGLLIPLKEGLQSSLSFSAASVLAFFEVSVWILSRGGTY